MAARPRLPAGPRRRQRDVRGARDDRGAGGGGEGTPVRLCATSMLRCKPTLRRLPSLPSCRPAFSPSPSRTCRSSTPLQRDALRNGGRLALHPPSDGGAGIPRSKPAGRDARALGPNAHGLRSLLRRRYPWSDRREPISWRHRAPRGQLFRLRRRLAEPEAMDAAVFRELDTESSGRHDNPGWQVHGSQVSAAARSLRLQGRRWPTAAEVNSKRVDLLPRRTR